MHISYLETKFDHTLNRMYEEGYTPDQKSVANLRNDINTLVTTSDDSQTTVLDTLLRERYSMNSVGHGFHVDDHLYNERKRMSVYNVFKEYFVVKKDNEYKDGYKRDRDMSVTLHLSSDLKKFIVHVVFSSADDCKNALKYIRLPKPTAFMFYVDINGGENAAVSVTDVMRLRVYFDALNRVFESNYKNKFNKKYSGPSADDTPFADDEVNNNENNNVVSADNRVTYNKRAVVETTSTPLTFRNAYDVLDVAE